jgi:hypothetical protein
MRTSTKEWLKLLGGVAIFSVPGVWGLYQLYCAIADGVIFWRARRGADSITGGWITYDTGPGDFVTGLTVYGLLALLFLVVVVATISFPYIKDRWRSRQFVDYALRRPPDSEA